MTQKQNTRVWTVPASSEQGLNCEESLAKRETIIFFFNKDFVLKS